MSKVNIKIWNREFALDVEYYGQLEEDMTSPQKEALEDFIEAGINIDKSLEELKEYVLKTANGNIDNVKNDNIFRYVMPKYIYIPRKKDTVSIMCNYKFDMENGIAIVFENGKLKQIGTEDIIL